MASATTPLSNRLQTLPEDMKQTVFSYLTMGDRCAVIKVCKDLHQSISRVHAQEPAHVQRVLTAHKWLEHVLEAGNLRPTLEELVLEKLDLDISQLETRLEQIRKAQRAASDKNYNYSEEDAIASQTLAYCLKAEREKQIRKAQPAASDESHEHSEEVEAIERHILEAAKLELIRIREAQPAASDESHDHSEEAAIKSRLEILYARRLPPRRIIDLVLEYYKPFSNVIDMKQWDFFIGQVPYNLLRPSTETRLSEPCSIFQGKTKEETHICIDIPPTVNGHPLTLNQLLYFAQKNRGNKISLDIAWDKILPELGNIPIPFGQYFLLKTCLPGTKGKTYQEQLAVLKRHPEYMAATLPQVLAASLMEYIRSGDAKTWLFKNEYALTSSTVDSLHLVFSGGGGAPFWPPRVTGYDEAEAFGIIGLAVVLMIPE